MRRSARAFVLGSALLFGCTGAVGGDDGLDASTDSTAASDARSDSPADAPAEVADVVDAVDAEVALDVVDAPEVDPHPCPSGATPRDCSPGPGKGTADECHDAPSCYLKTVQKAVNGLVSTHPEWFDFTGPGGCPVIKNVDQFLDAVVADVAAQGLCIERDPNAPGEEVTVKKDNAFAESFDLVSSAGCARSGDPIYTGYCAPAWW